MLIKTKTAKGYFEVKQFDNILRLFNVLSNFNSTTSEPMGDYYISTRYTRVASRVAERLKTEEVKELRNIRKVTKLHKMTT